MFLYVPIFVLIVFSFNTTKSRTVLDGFTFDWYIRLFRNELILNSLWNTVLISVSAATISTILGTAAAIGINNMRKVPKAVVMNVNSFPIINPEIVTGVSMMLLFVFFAARMNLEFGFTTLIIAHITFDVPYVVMNVMPKLRQLDENIYEAAQDLGCPPLRAFFKVVIPEIMPGIITGMMMAFTLSLDDFVISYFTSGSTAQTLPMVIYSMTKRRLSPKVNALSTIMFVIVLVLLVIVNFRQIREDAKSKKLQHK
jgi:spermidine/putrescine transport system permease protein